MDCDNCNNHYILGDREYCKVDSKDVNCPHYNPIEPDDKYEDFKSRMLHDGICEEDADLAIATIKRIRGEK